MKKYNIPDEEEQNVASESEVVYSSSNCHPKSYVHSIESSASKDRVSAAVDALRDSLHPSTVAFLDSVDWMKDKSFPQSETPMDDSWIDQAELVADSDIVPEEIMIKDLAAWRSVR